MCSWRCKKASNVKYLDWVAGFCFSQLIVHTSSEDMFKHKVLAIKGQAQLVITY